MRMTECHRAQSDCRSIPTREQQQTMRMAPITTMALSGKVPWRGHMRTSGRETTASQFPKQYSEQELKNDLVSQILQMNPALRKGSCYKSHKCSPENGACRLPPCRRGGQLPYDTRHTHNLACKFSPERSFAGTAAVFFVDFARAASFDIAWNIGSNTSHK